jgi:hypothetical protein
MGHQDFKITLIYCPFLFNCFKKEAGRIVSETNHQINALNKQPGKLCL